MPKKRLIINLKFILYNCVIDNLRIKNYMKINKLLLVGLFLAIFNISSQEYDEDYLSSLPDDVREELLKKAEDKDDFEKPMYSTKISSLDKDEEDESILRGVFGENFFTSYQSTFMPINEPNFDASYVLDYGDVLKIQLIGQKNSINDYMLKRDGSINLEDVGKISLSGLTLAESVALIKSRLKSVYIATEAFISIENVRDINILVAGNAYKPGIYTMSGNSNPLQALVMAGGINEFGSFREIIVKRNNKVIETIDLYDYLIFGNFTNYQRLQSGDLIFVEKTQNLVTVDGAVKRPMIYEMKKSENLGTAINFANGTDIKADLSNITLDRIDNGSINRIEIQKLEDMNDMISMDQDIINVGSFNFREVTIKGAVNNPGKYLMKEGDGILELINRSGGYTKTAYPFGGIYNNEASKEVAEIAAKKLYNDLVELILNQTASNPESSDVTAILELANTVDDIEPSGRVNVEFDLGKILENPELNTILQNLDEIIIPEISNYVYIFGEVSNEGNSKFQSGRNFQYYIDKQGGFLSSADIGSVYILQPNGESIKADIQKNIFMNNPKNVVQIYPGSVIYVPRDIDDGYLRRQSIQAYAAILGNIGVSLASLSVLKD